MRVLFVNTRYAPEGRAGPAFSVQSLAEQHARKAGSSIVFCRSDRHGVSHEIVNGVEIIRAGVDLATEQCLALWGQVLDQFRPDIVHTNLLLQMPPTLLARQAKQRRLKLVHTIREVSLICPQEGMRDGRMCLAQCEACRVATAPRREFAHLVDAAVGVSHFILDLHQRAGLFPASQAAGVIHNSYWPPQRLQVASPVGAPVRIGFLGRLDPTKGVELLLRTLSGPLAARSWTLAVAGKGSIAGRGAPEYEERLKRTFRDPRISYLGFVAPHVLLSQIDVVIVPSLLPEAFARVAIEACAHGVAVIGSSRGGIPEAIVDGVTGLLFEPDAIEGSRSLAAVIESLLDAPDRLAVMKQQALVRWRQHFTPEKIHADYRRVYEAIAAA